MHGCTLSLVSRASSSRSITFFFFLVYFCHDSTSSRKSDTDSPSDGVDFVFYVSLTTHPLHKEDVARNSVPVVVDALDVVVVVVVVVVAVLCFFASFAAAAACLC